MGDLDQDASSRSSSRGSSFSLCHMTESAYAKVIFCEIHDSYSAESDVECLYQLSELIVPHPDDYIGLFRVGWQDVSECITSVPCSSAICNSSLAGDSYNKIVFKVADLPKDDLEYYQFLYLTKEHEICGASTPFKFHVVHEDENVVVLSVEHDFLEVKSSTSLLQHQLADTQKYVAFLEKAKMELEDKIASVEKEKEEAKAQIEKEKLVKQDFEVQLQFCLLSLVEGVKELPPVPACCKAVESSIHDLKSVLDRLTKDNNSLKMKNVIMQRDLAKIKSDFDTHKTKELELTMQNTALADSVKISLQQLSMENVELKKGLSDTKDLFRASEECKSLIRQELENVKKSKDEMSSSMEDLKLLNSLLKKQLANNETAIKDMEKVWKELEEVKLNYDSEKESWDKHRGELEKQIDDLTSHLKEVVALRDKTDKQCSMLKQEVNDMTIHLKESTNQLKRKDEEFKELEQQLDDIMKKSTVKETEVPQKPKDQHIIELEAQIGDLKLRLREASELYKEQYLEIRTLRRALKSSESSKRKNSSDGTKSFSNECSRCSSADGGQSLEAPATLSSLSSSVRSSLSSSVRSIASNNEEQSVKVENKQLQNAPDSRPANSSGGYMAWSGCSSFADINFGQASAPVEEETGFCNVPASPAHEMDSSTHLLMVSGSRNPNETIFVRSTRHNSPSEDIIQETDMRHNSSRNQPLREFNYRDSSMESHQEPISLSRKVPEVYDLPCPLCDEVITVSGNNTSSMDDHLLYHHQQQICPVCGRMFDKALPSNYFKYHVENHFTSKDSTK